MTDNWDTIIRMPTPSSTACPSRTKKLQSRSGTKWHDESTGATLGYAAENGYVLIMGNPLCDRRLRKGSVPDLAAGLARGAGYSRHAALLANDELHCGRADVGNHQTVAKKERQAGNAGLNIYELPAGEPPPDELRRRVDKRIEDWNARRRNKKRVRLTEVRPWVDMEHRMFLWTENKDG